MGIISSIDSARTIRGSLSVSYYTGEKKETAHLQKITLFEPSAHQLYSLSKTCPNLIQLTITLPVDTLRIIHGVCSIKSLEHLTIAPSLEIRQKAIDIITKQLTNLVSFRSWKMQYSDRDVELITSRLKKITFLSLNENKISQKGFQNIVNAYPRMKVLELFNNFLHHTLSAEFLITNNLPHLEILHLNHIKIASYQLFGQNLPNLKIFKVISDYKVLGTMYLGLLKKLKEFEIRYDNSYNLTKVSQKLAFNCKRTRDSLISKAVNYIQIPYSYQSQRTARNEKLFSEMRNRQLARKEY